MDLKKRIGLLAAVVLGGILLAIPADRAWPHKTAPAPDRDITKNIKKEKKELKQLKHKLQEQHRKRHAARKREKSILAQLEEMDYRLVVKKKELSVVNLKLQERAQAIEELDRELPALQKEVASKKDRVRASVRVLYQERRMNTLRILFASTDYYDFLKRYYYLSWISQRESEWLSNYRITLARLSEKEGQLRTVQADLLKGQREVAAKLKEIRAEKRKKATLLARVRKGKAIYERTIRELAGSADRVTALIEELEKRQEQSLASAGFFHQKGRMNWPTTGKVVAFFGRQRHPKFDTFITRKGIEIQSKQGQPIRTVYQGTVVYADWFRGYGLLVILDHGENYYSLYAHAAKLRVSVDDHVESQQIIGEIGDTGLTGGANLYFEIRRGGVPLNPLTWLKKKGMEE